MLTDLVRCTVLAEDLHQVRLHDGSEVSTPVKDRTLSDLGTTCTLQRLPEKMRSTPCTLGLRDHTPQQVEALMATLEARSVVGLAGAEKVGGGGDEEDPMQDKSIDERVFRITAIKNRFSCTSTQPFPCT